MSDNNPSDAARVRSCGLALAIAVVALTLAVPTHAETGATRRSGSSVRNAQHRPVDPALFAEADWLISDEIDSGNIPGAVLLVGRSSGTVYLKAYGNRANKPEPAAMTTDTVFDLASLSKPIGCATSVMLLAERGKIDLDERASTYLPAFAANGKENITVAHLLLHQGGLIPDNALSDYEDGYDAAMKAIYALKPQAEPGAEFTYTDVGYIVLGELVRAVDGRPLEQFAKEEIFKPLGMKRTAYNPPKAWKKLYAPTEKREGRWMVGEVHDPRAYALGGAAGHAGLFSTAEDVGRYCRMILNRGRLDGRRVLKRSTVEEMTRPRPLPGDGGTRSYGFDVDTPYSSPRGTRFARGSTFGHTGFTGTSFWVDPENDCYVILLTNSVHPDGKGKVIQLRRTVATVVATALLDQAPKPEAGEASAGGGDEPVLCGIDVLKRDNFKALQGRRVGLVTNHTGLDREGNRLVTLLANADGVELVKIFSPEHGLYGVLDEKVGDATDPETGLKVYSLYGESRKPTKEMLEGLDTLVFDIQDIGARYYTYISTLGLCMEAAAEHGVKVVVLDRPNPVTGLIVDGPLADETDLGFTAYAPIPVSHGMTVGELANLFNAERGINCDLTVIPVESWRRSMWWDDTGLMWVNPSPNMRNTTQALLYLGIGLLEASNLSVGRGTDQPFETFGAPWVDGRKLAKALNEAALPGLRFVPIAFTPKSSKFANERCEGVYILVTEREAVEPVRAGLTIARTLQTLFGDAFQIRGVNNLMKNAATMEALAGGKDLADIFAAWEQPLEQFKQTREKYLLY